MASTQAPDRDPSSIHTNADMANEKKDNNSTDANPLSNSDVEKQEPECPPCAPQSRFAGFKSLGFLDRFLAVWIFLAMLIGILLGNFVDSVGPALQRGNFVDVSVPIAIGLLVMMYPILCKVEYEKLHEVFRTREIWIQMGFSIIINWIIAPLLMFGLAWAFLPDEQGLREGLILVGIARCIAMVLIWNNLAGGNGDYCAILVALNSLLQIVLFAPLSLLFIRVFNPGSTESAITIDYETVATSVGVFLGIPLGAAILTRFVLLYTIGPDRYRTHFIRFVAPWSLIGLLFTILVLFASQGKQVVRQIVSVVRVSAPLIVYFCVVFFVTLFVAKRMGFRYSYSVTQSFTAASNNFELAIAVAVAAYGPHSDQALAATVGPLIEVPVLLGLVYGVKWFAKRRGWSD